MTDSTVTYTNTKDIGNLFIETDDKFELITKDENGNSNLGEYRPKVDRLLLDTENIDKNMVKVLINFIVETYKAGFLVDLTNQHFESRLSGPVLGKTTSYENNVGAINIGVDGISDSLLEKINNTAKFKFRRNAVLPLRAISFNELINFPVVVFNLAPASGERTSFRLLTALAAIPEALEKVNEENTRTEMMVVLWEGEVILTHIKK